MTKTLSYMLVVAGVVGSRWPMTSTPTHVAELLAKRSELQSDELPVDVQQRLIELMVDELWGKDEPLAPRPGSHETLNKVPSAKESWAKWPDPKSTLRVKTEHVALVLYGEAEFQARAADELTEALLRRMSEDLYGAGWQVHERVRAVLNPPPRGK